MSPNKSRSKPGTSAVRAARRGAPQRTNWAHWQDTHMLPLRDAVALSLDFEPSTVTVEHAEFANRLKIAVAHFRSKRLLKVNLQTRALTTQPALSQVWLPHFAAWAKAKPKWEMPPGLARIAQAKLSAAAKTAAGPVQRRAIQTRSWQQAVRALADELHLRDQRAGVRSTTKDIALRAAIEAAKNSIHGPRGELTPQNILRAALQGGKWKRPRLKRKSPG